MTKWITRWIAVALGMWIATASGADGPYPAMPLPPTWARDSILASSPHVWYWRRGNEIAMAGCKGGRAPTATARVIPDDAPAVSGYDHGVKVGTAPYVARRWAQGEMTDRTPLWRGFWAGDPGREAAEAFLRAQCR